MSRNPSPLKPQAQKLYLQGFSPDEIAKKLGKSKRQVQRWVSELKDSDLKTYLDLEEVTEQSAEALNNQNELAEKINLQATSEAQNFRFYRYEDDHWENLARRAATEHAFISRNIRNLAYQSLLNEAALGNWSQVKTLSVIVSRHLADEHRALSLDYLNLDRAIDLLLKNKINLDEYQNSTN